MKAPIEYRRSIRDRELHIRRHELQGIERTPLNEVSRFLKLDLAAETWRRLETQPRVVVLDSGCGETPAALNELAETFKRETEGGRLELNGVRLTSSLPDGNVCRLPNGVRLHNTPARKLTIKPDMIFDHSGSVFWQGIALNRLVKILRPGGVLAFHDEKGAAIPGWLASKIGKAGGVLQLERMGENSMATGGKKSACVHDIFHVRKRRGLRDRPMS